MIHASQCSKEEATDWLDLSFFFFFNYISLSHRDWTVKPLPASCTSLQQLPLDSCAITSTAALVFCKNPIGINKKTALKAGKSRKNIKKCNVTKQ